MPPKEGSYQYRQNLTYVKQTPKFLQSLLNQNKKIEEEKDELLNAAAEAYEKELTDEQPVVVASEKLPSKKKKVEMKEDDSKAHKIEEAKNKLEGKLEKFETESVTFGKLDKSVKRPQVEKTEETEKDTSKKSKIISTQRNKNLLSFDDEEV